MRPTPLPLSAMELTKAQMNDLWREIKAGGLDPRTCKRENTLSADGTADLQISSRSEHFVQIQYFAAFRNYRVYWSPGLAIRAGGRGARPRRIDPATGLARLLDSGQDWPGVLEEVREWAAAVQRQNQEEIDAARAAKAAADAQAMMPDLWALGYDPEAASLVAAAEDSDDNRPFTTAEQAEIASQIRAIKESMRQHSELTSEQLNRIEARLDDAEEASHRLGRKDWIMLFAGGVFALILADAIPPDIAHQIFTGVVHGLSHLFASGHIPGMLNS